MGRCGALGLWFQSVSENTLSQFGKLILLLLSIPCFKFSNAFFQFTYTSRQRRLRLLGSQSAMLGGENYALEFEDLPLHLNRPAYIKERLRKIESRLKASENSGGIANVTHCDRPCAHASAGKRGGAA